MAWSARDSAWEGSSFHPIREADPRKELGDGDWALLECQSLLFEIPYHSTNTRNLKTLLIQKA